MTAPHQAIDTAIGWTLLHSLWEGAALALLLAIVLGLTRSPRIRYWAACLAMIVLLAGFGVTLVRLLPASGPRIFLRSLPPTDAPVLLKSVAKASWELTDVLPWLAPVWLAGVLLFQLRCLAAWLATSRMKSIGVCAAPASWTAKLDRLQVSLRMPRAVTLLESCLADVPVVIGYVRPVILIPVGLLAGLPAGQMEAILLHELAHIRRGDYLVNLLQTMVEGLLFYHPAVWWISHIIRSERENCCDDIVVSTSGDAHEYATALATLAEIRWETREAAIAATGGNLVKRIRRLLAQPETPRLGPIVSAGILVMTCALALAAWQTPQQGPPAIVPVIPAPLAPPIQAHLVRHVAQPKAVPSISQMEALEKLHDLVENLEAKRATPSFLLALAQIGPNDPVPSRYQKWLREEVPYIITDAERKAFRSITNDAERDLFIQQFWARRDPSYPKTGSMEEYPIIPKGNPNNAFRNEYYRRIAYVNDRFKSAIPGWKTDRGRIYIEYGPPDEIESHPKGGSYERPAEQGGGATTTYPFEQWLYRVIDGVGKNVMIEFVDRTGTGEYHMTVDPSEKDALLHVPGANLTMAEQMGLNLRYSSKGTGAPASVVFHTSDGGMTLSVPLEFEARQYLITVSTAKADGTSPDTALIVANSCKSTPGDSNCVSDVFRTTSPNKLARGNYELKAIVKDSGSATEKTYVINFSIH